MTDNPDIAEALVRDLTAASMEPKVILDGLSRERMVLVPLPTGYAAHAVDLDNWEPHPMRKTGVADLRDRASLIEYVQRQAEDTALYANPDDLTVTAVFDDHHNEFAGWREFKACLKFRPTPEWEAWRRVDRVFWSAEELAEFIEQWRHTIADPPHADLLGLVRSFRATRNVSFRDERIEATGDRSLEYVTETTAGGKGQLDVPDSLTLVMAPFEGADDVTIVARFRYRLESGSASFGFVLEQPDLVKRDAFEAELAALSGALTLPIMLGTAAH